jgi:hypothetical protein
MKSQNNQGQGKWESRLLDWESRISDGAWWGIYIFAVLGLLHIAIVPFFERQFFGQGGVYALVCLQVIVGLLVRFKVIRITPKELALYQVGFIFLWFAYIPSWFYWGDDRPWHQRGLAEQFLGLYVMERHSYPDNISTPVVCFNSVSCSTMLDGVHHVFHVLRHDHKQLVVRS